MLIDTYTNLTKLPKCRYIPERDLPPVASHGQVDAILCAIKSGEILIGGLAETMAASVWDITIPHFVEAVAQHLVSGQRLFIKTITKPKPDRTYFHANVCLDPAEPDEELDVYVEIQLCNGVFVIIRDAHNHIEPYPRLPK